MKKHTAILLALPLAAFAAPEGLSPEALECLKESAPFAFWAFPAGRQTKVNPLVSEKKRQPDKKISLDIKTSPFVLTEFSEDGRLVSLAYELPKPAKKGGSKKDAEKADSPKAEAAFTNGWFKVEDVLSLGKAEPEEASAEDMMLLYSPWGEKPPRPRLVGSAEKGISYKDFGERKAGKEAFRLALIPAGELEVCGKKVAARLVYAAEAPAATNIATYVKRVERLLSEEPYAHGTFWDNTVHPMLIKSGNLGCAALVTDFARYVFGAGNFNQGEKFEKPDEIRAGDVISIKGHFLAVLDRDGDRLITFEGNFCKSVWYSDSSYSLIKGGWAQSGKLAPDNFICGWHYLGEKPAKKLGIKIKRK